MYNDIEKVKVLSNSHQLVLMVYKATNLYPKSELFCLVSQMRRAAVSVPSNIIEGKSRGMDKEFIRFLKIARGSLEELKYQFKLSFDLNYIGINEIDCFMKQADITGKQINSLINSIKG